jgi:Cu(I)/Ag(I) efflux system membrane fusion protein
LTLQDLWGFLGPEGDTMSRGQAAGGEGHQQLPEGEEQAPPGTRTMSLVRWGLVVLMAMAAAGAWGYHLATRASASAAQGQKFVCPMHPQIVTDHKGECPICGMDLVAAGTSATPPMVAATPAAASNAMAPPAGGPAQYTCPMHPEVVTTDPAARCPECHMKLVPRAPAPAADAAPPAAGAEGVRGLVPVELSSDRIQLMGMKTAVASREALTTSLRAAGFVTLNEAGLTSVSLRYSGWVETLQVAQAGQLVQKGEALMTVYSPELVNAQTVFLNAIKWAAPRTGSGAPQQATDAERDPRQRLELFGVALEDIDAIVAAGVPQRTVPVRAPARGYVARKNVLKGLFVQAGSEIFQLADLSTVWVLVDVSESDLARVRLGQKATFESSSAPGQRFSGRVQFINPVLSTGSRTLQARVELPNPGLELRPGMFGDVTLETGAAEAVVIPADALVDTGDHRYVFVDRGGGRFEPRAVHTGASGGGKVAVLEGLAAGERVVVKAGFLLDSESRLRAAIEGHGK